ncbi:MAG: hypothetical protein ABJN40_01595 [Sneathiella sp.]
MDHSGNSLQSRQVNSVAQLSERFSSSAQYHHAPNGSEARSVETLRASAVQVQFNNNAEIFSPGQARHTILNETTRNQVDLSIERSNVLSTHQKHWEETIRKKLVASSLPEPSNDLGAIRTRDINAEYQSLLKAHQMQQSSIHTRYTSHIEKTRKSGITLSDSFTRSGQPSNEVKFQRPVINQRSSEKAKDKCRTR